MAYIFVYIVLEKLFRSYTTCETEKNLSGKTSCIDEFLKIQLKSEKWVAIKSEISKTNEVHGKWIFLQFLDQACMHVLQPMGKEKICLFKIYY